MTTMAYQITSLTVVYSIVYSGADQRKHQSSGTGEFPLQRASNAENVSIWWRHPEGEKCLRCNHCHYILENITLATGDATWHHGTRSTLVWVMTWCLMTPNLYWTNIELSSTRSVGIQLRAMPQEMAQPGTNGLTHWGLMTHIWVIIALGNSLMPSYYLNQCWLVDWSFRNKFQCDFYQNNIIYF